MEFCGAVYQVAAGERPPLLPRISMETSSWQLQCVQGLVRTAAISVARCDKRLFGRNACQKPPKWWTGKTSCCQMNLLKNLDGRNGESFDIRVLRHPRACGNGGGQKSQPTERFPLRLVATISRPIASLTWKSRRVPLNATESGDTGDVNF